MRSWPLRSKSLGCEISRLGNRLAVTVIVVVVTGVFVIVVVVIMVVVIMVIVRVANSLFKIRNTEVDLQTPL